MFHFHQSSTPFLLKVNSLNFENLNTSENSQKKRRTGEEKRLQIIKREKKIVKEPTLKKSFGEHFRKIWDLGNCSGKKRLETLETEDGRFQRNDWFYPLTSSAI